MKLSGKELAEKIGCARSTLSDATREGRKIYGRFPVDLWAVRNADGRVQRYDVPEDAAFLDDEVRENPAQTPNSANSRNSPPSLDEKEVDLSLSEITEMIGEKEETTRKVAEEAGGNTQLVSDKTDVQGTARNAGLAYAATKAIEHDTPGARAFWTIASALAGGIGGHALSDGNPWLSTLGAIGFGGAGYFAYEQQSGQQDPAPQRSLRPGQSSQVDSFSSGGRGSAVDLGKARSAR